MRYINLRLTYLLTYLLTRIHTRRDKVIAISAPPYIVSADNNTTIRINVHCIIAMQTNKY